jgi:phage terminase Nu1 subunit (DNA packaging protein)
MDISWWYSCAKEIRGRCKAVSTLRTCFGRAHQNELLRDEKKVLEVECEVVRFLWRKCTKEVKIVLKILPMLNT